MSRKRKEPTTECGRRIEKLLDDNNMNQTTLAEKINIDPRYLSAIKMGRRPLSRSNAEEIAKVFPGTRVAWLLGYDSYETEDDRTRSIVKFHADYLTLTEELIKSHGYKIIRSRDEDNKEVVTIISPRGTKKTVYEVLFIKLIDSINDYVEGQILLGFRELVFDNEYYGRCW